jgi:hypothetical protein
MTFRIRENGEEHIAGDPNCPGCQSPDDEHWPQLHRDEVSRCPGLVHVESFPKDITVAGSSVLYYCDGCKAENPI